MEGKTGEVSEMDDGTKIEEIIVRQNEKVDCYHCEADVYVRLGLLSSPQDIVCWSCGESMGTTRAVAEYPVVWQPTEAGE